MLLVKSTNALLQTLSERMASLSEPWGEEKQKMATGFPAIDALLPHGGLAGGTVHEVIGSTRCSPALWPLLMVRSGIKAGWVVWSDPGRRFYPSAAAALGLSLQRLVVLRPDRPRDELWAIEECLRCRGVDACVAALGKLSRVQVRRLQLAAEKGGGIGILVRPREAIGWPYAAATRWLVRPLPGERTLQRCQIELIHGHGGRIGQSAVLEVCRETHHVRAVETMAHRQNSALPIAAGA